MLPPSQNANPVAPSSRYIDELREFFSMHQLPFGSPEDIVKLADGVSKPGMFETEMGAMVRSIILREGGNLPVAELLEIVAVAIGGLTMEERAPEFAGPIQGIVGFLGTAFRARWGYRPEELAEDLPPPVPKSTKTHKPQAVVEVAPEARAATSKVHSSSRIFAARAISEGGAADGVWPVLDAPPEGVPEPLKEEAAEVSFPPTEAVKAEPEVGLEPLVHEVVESYPATEQDVELKPLAHEASVAAPSVETEPEVKLEPPAHEASEVASATLNVEAEPVVGLEPLGHEAAESSPAAEPAVELEPLAHEAAEVVSATAPDVEAQAAIGLEPLIQQSSEVSFPATRVEPVPEVEKMSEVSLANLRLPRFLEVAVAEQKEFEARPWISRHAGWVVAILLAAAAIVAGAWAYERGLLRAGVRNELMQPVVTRPAVIASPVVKPVPLPDKAKSGRMQRRGSARSGQQRVRPSGQTKRNEPPAPIERVNPAGSFPATTPAPKN